MDGLSGRVPRASSDEPDPRLPDALVSASGNHIVTDAGSRSALQDEHEVVVSAERNDSEAVQVPEAVSEPPPSSNRHLDESNVASTSALAELSTVVESLASQTNAFHERAEHYELIIREMQSRLEQLQGDQVQALLKPVMQRLATIHAQATEAAVRAHDLEESAEKDFNFFVVAIEEAFGLLDIECVRARPHDRFDPSRHHASRIVPTDDPDLDERVQRVLRQGFTYIDAPRVFLPAQVSIYRYRPLPNTLDASGKDDGPAISPLEGDLDE